jgi:D-citramalate synthase
MLEILDTTLRDGEQTAGVSFNANEKLTIARQLLDDVGVDRIEVASARVSDGERKAVESICHWADDNGLIDKVEVLGFVDNGVSIDWIANAGGRVLNLLTKGSLRHVTMQLKKTPEEHLADIRRNIEMAMQKGLSVNIYLEDWSNGMIHSKDYVMYMLDNLQDMPIRHYMLPDTLGVLTPDLTKNFCREIVQKYP